MEHDGSTSRPMVSAHYHHILFGSRRVFYDVKITIVVIVGGVIIIACLAYIIVQCRVKGRSSSSNSSSRNCSREALNCSQSLDEKKQEEEEEEDEEVDLSLAESDTTEALLPYPNAIPMKVRKEREFYV